MSLTNPSFLCLSQVNLEGSNMALLRSYRARGGWELGCMSSSRLHSLLIVRLSVDEERPSFVVTAKIVIICNKDRPLLFIWNEGLSLSNTSDY